MKAPVCSRSKSEDRIPSPDSDTFTEPDVTTHGEGTCEKITAYSIHNLLVHL